MPIYDYKCLECGHVSEIFHRSLVLEPVRCSSCNGENLERCFSASYLIKIGSTISGTTCCGKTERCDTPSCSEGYSCRRI